MSTLLYRWGRIIDPPGPAEGEAATEAIQTARDAGLQAELSREIVGSTDEAGGSEAIGLAVAALVLLVAFGSVIAGGIPVGSAVFGIFIGLGLVTVMAGFTDVSSVSPMIGIGVGIDYALFVVTRHRGFLADGKEPAEAAGLANATAGTAVLFAGTTVVIALLGLIVAGIPSIARMGYVAAITVAVAMACAVTLLPAFLGLAGHRIDRWRIGGRRALETTDRSGPTMAARWADHAGRHPWRYAIAALVGLIVVALPVLDMRIGNADDGTAGTEHTYRRAYDLLAEGFGQGFNAPLTIAIQSDGQALDDTALAAVHDEVAALPGVAAATEPVIGPTGTTAVMTPSPRPAPRTSEQRNSYTHCATTPFPRCAENCTRS